jgi:glycosyltransferase involved in cell wall biosynthesis
VNVAAGVEAVAGADRDAGDEDLDPAAEERLGAEAAIGRAARAALAERREVGETIERQRHHAVDRVAEAAADQARHDWILSLDADERISDPLRVAIERARDAGFAGASGYRFARLSWYFGKFLHHGNAYPDRGLRLFDRRRGGWQGQREVHEAASVDGPVLGLEGDVIHFPYRSLEQQLAKTQKYARMMAEHDHARGKRASLLKLVLSPAWRFWRGYVLRLGFLDGWQGLVYAYVRANYVRQKSIMLLMLERGQPLVDPPRE